jgi:hypothetical protein
MKLYCEGLRSNVLIHAPILIALSMIGDLFRLAHCRYVLNRTLRSLIQGPTFLTSIDVKAE